MYLAYFSLNVDLKELMFGGEDWNFLPETIIRTLIMMLVILLSLRILGKRGVKQLSIFELVVILGLGSAAGDPMFYKDVGILPAVIVFIMIIGIYKLIIFFIAKSKRFEDMIEGKPISIIKDGAFSVKNFEKESFGEDEFFAELRMQGVSQIGQVEEAIEETSGDISIFFYEDDEVKYGLPVMPDSLENWQYKIDKTGYYSCIFCGYTEEMKPVEECSCPKCNKKKWVKSSNKKRIS
jgi:uncharacterized membrane protein YcaP (DUF421 family)